MIKANMARYLEWMDTPIISITGNIGITDITITGNIRLFLSNGAIPLIDSHLRNNDLFTTLYTVHLRSTLVLAS